MRNHASVYDIVAHFIRYNIGEINNDKLLLAVSGGLDSIAMLHILQHLGYSVAIAHCNFRLRGKESEEDESFTASIAKKLGVHFHSKSFDTESYAAQNRCSVQMAARELRYEWFDSLCAKEDYRWIVTAHHLNDHLETIVFNQAKGTGLAGLHGILPLSGNIIRPLLCLTRADILEFATSSKFSWREDSSNKSDKYARNYIRHQIVPKLSEINPAIESTYWENAQKNLQAESIVSEEIERWRQSIEHLKGFDVLPFQALKKTPAGVLILHELIKDYGFNYTQCQEVLSIRGQESGKMFQSDNFELLIDRDRLILSPLPKKTSAPLMIRHPGISQYEHTFVEVTVLEDDQPVIDTSAEILQVDAKSISWPLEIRYWMEGDHLIPLGMKGKKKVSDLMIDLKIPLNLKREQLIVSDQLGIIWVANLRMADRVKITDHTESVMTIKLKRA